MLRWLIPFLFLPLLSQGQVSKLFTKAESGDAKAMMRLSEKYLFGFDLPKNEDSARFWRAKALETGDPDAQFLVGLEYTGAGFDQKRFREGMGLLEQAAEKDHPEALLRLSEIYRTRGKGTATDEYYSPTKAYSFAERSAINDNGEAMYFCAESRLEGRGTEQSDSIAFVYMRYAAIQLKYIPAKLRLGDFLLEGTGMEQIDPFGALKQYRQVVSHRRSNIEQRSTAKLGIHRVDQVLRQWQNAMNGASGIMPRGAFDFELRE